MYQTFKTSHHNDDKDLIKKKEYHLILKLEGTHN